MEVSAGLKKNAPTVPGRLRWYDEGGTPQDAMKMAKAFIDYMGLTGDVARTVHGP